MKPEPSNHEQSRTTNADDFARAIVNEYQGPLTRYATRFLGDADRARDVVQDTFMRLMERPVGEVDGHLAEWLFTVCRHRALDILRKEARMSRFEEGQIERVATDDPRPGRALEHEEAHTAMLRLIDGLPASQQEVIRLKFQNGFSYKEISRITDLSVSHVGVLIHNAVQRLRADFAAQKS
ncbi:RNA polymerase sigma factor (sigma-70 family) [Ereboglobus sp. PH5-5]|uniref:RNA polymerase sigma factor n=1 Tax=Ereboglobus sp. PH5-5 TaxID=2940529 RepID=UPI0024058538|nr:sigma-70 family RNA polymerase sigma factor [Ereboglobus sp. PH5-5]MDF9831901.1 RNA polymerase sigma factor (sigma-70 family) [Ereboglobus sp. PH5-5]